MAEDLSARVAALERQLAQLRDELHDQIVGAAHALRKDDEFMKPASQRFTDHAGRHMFDKVARKLLILVIGALAAAAYGVAAWLTGRGFAL